MMEVMTRRRLWGTRSDDHAFVSFIQVDRSPASCYRRGMTTTVPSGSWCTVTRTP